MLGWGRRALVLVDYQHTWRNGWLFRIGKADWTGTHVVEECPDGAREGSKERKVEEEEDELEAFFFHAESYVLYVLS